MDFSYTFGVKLNDPIPRTEGYPINQVSLGKDWEEEGGSQLSDISYSLLPWETVGSGIPQN